MRNKVGLKALAILFAIVMVASSVAMYSVTDVEKGINEGGGKNVISLVAPPFISIAGASEMQSGGGGGAAPRAGTTSLAEEAGISAYTNVGESIDLEKARTAFRTIENETNEYLVGSVPLPDYPETEDVHAYVHKDGWVVTYYLKEEPVAKIVDWEDYSTEEKITGTKLVDGVSVVCNAAGVPIRDLKYYDFRYANADKLMIIADALWSQGTDTFNVKLPSDFVYYERSFSHYFSGAGYGGANSRMYIDEDEISYIGEGGGTKYGLLSPTQLSLDEFQTIKLSRSHNTAFDAIVLIYREA